jgi:hypothetical protein
MRWLHLTPPRGARHAPFPTPPRSWSTTSRPMHTLGCSWARHAATKLPFVRSSRQTFEEPYRRSLRLDTAALVVYYRRTAVPATRGDRSEQCAGCAYGAPASVIRNCVTNSVEFATWTVHRCAGVLQESASHLRMPGAVPHRTWPHR